MKQRLPSPNPSAVRPGPSRALWGTLALGSVTLLALSAGAAPGSGSAQRSGSSAQAASKRSVNTPAKRPTGVGNRLTTDHRPLTTKSVSFEKDVKPILVARCYACHGNGTRLGGFQIDSREGILTGSQATHPVVSPGRGKESFLIHIVSGKIPGKIMPPKGARLTPREIAILTAWVDQGLPFGSSGTAAAWKPPMAPRRPQLPAAQSGLSNPVDRLLQPYFKANRVTAATPVDDRTFARRAYLDLIGLLPPPEELRAFVADPGADKRARLVRELLARDRDYTEHWLTFWNDILRNDYAGTGYIDGGRLQITDWLYDSLRENKPYDRFVRELVNPTPESAGFVKGIVWRGVVNASQTPQMQAAQNISQIFMGVNMKCASCHDSFINNWKLADAYGMAGIYADAPLEMVRCDKPVGKVAPVKFLYPELGTIDGAVPKEQRMQRLAEILTAPQNGRLARTLVNRLWAKLMGRGLVEPHDDMDARPWSPELLDWLAADLADNGYNVKRTLEVIATSRAYSLPTAGQPSENVEGFVFRGPAVKRMSAEQFADSVSALTGIWSSPARQLRIVKGKPQLPGRAQVKFQSGVLRAGSVEIDVDITGAETLALVVTDANNGAGHDWADWVEPRLVGPQGEIRLTDLPWKAASTGYGQVRLNQSVVEKPLRLGQKTYTNGIGTHANSVVTYLLPPGVTRFKALAGPDAGALDTPNAPTSIEFAVITGDRALIEARAAMALSDPLTRALGRPNREQVVTQRATVATTLQAIELTNGQTLSLTLGRGAQQRLVEWGVGTAPARDTAVRIVHRLYELALSRRPTATEERTALELLGVPATVEGMEDLLWAVTMLPEFQLVH